MLVKIKPWDEAMEAALSDDESWFVDDDSIYGICRSTGKWGEVVSGYKKGQYFHSKKSFIYPLCVVDVIEDDKPTPDNILRYGKVITDDMLHTINSEVDRRPVTGDMRIRLIAYNGQLFYHKMIDGEVVDRCCVGKADA